MTERSYPRATVYLAVMLMAAPLAGCVVPLIAGTAVGGYTLLTQERSPEQLAREPLRRVFHLLTRHDAGDQQIVVVGGCGDIAGEIARRVGPIFMRRRAYCRVARQLLG